MIKWIKITAWVIISLTLLSAYSYSVKVLALKENNMGLYGSFVYRLTNLPDYFFEVVESNEVQGIPRVYHEFKGNNRQVNLLEQELYLLNSFWNNESNNWEFKLIELMKGSTIMTWYAQKDEYESDSKFLENARCSGPLLTKDKGLIYFHGESDKLIRIDENSEIVWTSKSHTLHHSINYNHDSSLVYVCGKKVSNINNLNDENEVYKIWDDLILAFDTKTGEQKFERSIVDLLIDYHLKGLAIGSATHLINKADPIHLNDIQVAYQNGPFMKQGDLFLSCRNKSMIIHYRPENDSLINIIQGDFIHQHDIDILSDTMISVFNNNIVKPSLNQGIRKRKGELSHTLTGPNITYINLKNKECHTNLGNQLTDLNLNTTYEGLHEHLASGRIFIELQNIGVLSCFDSNNELILRKTFDSNIEGYIQRPQWTRVFDELNW